MPRSGRSPHRGDRRPIARRGFLFEPLESRRLLSGFSAELLADINPTAGSFPADLILLGDKVLFSANDGTTGNELWSSDGTAQETAQVLDIRPGAAGSSPRNPILFNGKVFFYANDGSHGYELWSSDGTTAGTTRILDLYPGTSGSDFFTQRAVIGDTLYFEAINNTDGRQVFKTDGTAQGTLLVKSIGLGSQSPSSLTAVGSKLFFTADDAGNFDPPNRELWCSDGSDGGTFKVAEINPGGNAIDLFANTGVLNGVIYFAANDGVHGFEPWRSDNTPQGTFMIQDVNPGPGSSLFNGNQAFYQQFVPYNGNIYFQADDGVHGRELWKTDGTAGNASMLADLMTTGDAFPTSFTHHSVVANGKLFFSAVGDGVGPELWVTDGTTQGTTLVQDLNPGATGPAGPGFFCLQPQQSGSPLIFMNAYTTDTGFAPFVLDTGSLPYHINPVSGANSSDPTNFTALPNGQVLFSGDVGNQNKELFKVVEQPTITITGAKINDENGNGIIDDEDQPSFNRISGVTLFIDLNGNGVPDFDTASGQLEPTAVTNYSGIYEFPSRTQADAAKVKEVVPAGYVQTAVTTPFFGTGGKLYKDFLNFKTITVTGKKTLQSVGGFTTPLSGVKVYWDKNNNGARDVDNPATPSVDEGEPFGVTDSQGNYSIPGVGPGMIHLAEETPPGYTETSRPADFQAISGLDATGKDFVDTFTIPTIVVNSLLDNANPNDNLLTLREAINLANLTPDPDAIIFDPTLFKGAKTIKLLSSLPTILTPLEIDGPGPAKLLINGSNKFQLFNIQGQAGPPLPVTLRGLTLTGGNTAGDGGAIGSQFVDLTLRDMNIVKNNATGSGGGVFNNSGNLTITHSTISGNKSGADGGGVFAGGATVFDDVPFNTNSAARDGGAIFLASGASTMTDTTVTGNTAGRDGGGIFRSSDGGITWTRLTTANNTAGRDGGGIWDHGDAPKTWDDLLALANKAKRNGGGVYSSGAGALNINNGQFSHNFALRGGALWSDGTPVTANDVLFNFNTATGSLNDGGGGGIFNSGDMTILDAVLQGNEAFNGGGIFNDTGSPLHIFRSSIFDNHARSDGGGLFNQGTLNLINSTIGSNTANEFGGGFLNFIGGNANVRNCTLSGNHALTGQGGGFENFFGSADLDSSIVSGNFRGNNIPSDLQGTAAFNSLSSNNLIGDSASSGGLINGNNGNLIGVNPRLLPLGNYGGPTPTFLIPLGSPTIDAGNNLNNLTTDQRGNGFPRVIAGGPDIGAAEQQQTAGRQIVVTSSSVGGYTDANGNHVGVTVSGPGVVVIAFDTNAESANPSSISVFNSDSNTKVKIGVLPGTTTNVGNVLVIGSIGEIGGKGVSANNVHITGTPGKIKLGNVKDNHLIQIDGEGMTAKSAVTIELDEVAETSIVSAVPIKSLTVVRWDDDDGQPDVVRAPRLDKLVVTGNKVGPVAGDFEAGLDITGIGQSPLKPVLGAVTIAGLLGNTAGDREWNIDGSAGAVTAAKVMNAHIDVLAGLQSFTVKPVAGTTAPTYLNSNLTVHQTLGKVKLVIVQTNNSANGGNDFGISAHVLGSVEYFDASNKKVSVNQANPPPKTDGDFVIEII